MGWLGVGNEMGQGGGGANWKWDQTLSQWKLK
jgi:hypothetical protein